MKSRRILSVIFILASVFVIIEAWNFLSLKEAGTQERQLKNIQVYLAGDEISALFPMDDSLWVGGKDGVKRIDYKTGDTLDYIISDVQLIYAAEIEKSEKDGSIWIGHNEGVTVLFDNGKRLDFKEPDMKGGRVNTILETKQGIYVGTMQGCTLFVYQNGDWEITKTYDQSTGLTSGPVNVLKQINGDIWFGSYLDNKPGGISILTKDNSWNYIDVEDGLPHPNINAVLQTDNSILVGTGHLNAGGLAEIVKQDDAYSVSDSFGVEDGIPGEKIRQLYMDREKHIWITTESNGMILCRNAQCINHPIDGVVIDEKNGLSDNEIKCIVETDSDYWLGGRYGLTRIPKGTIDELLRKENEENE